jgi:autotransporter-associated beta strand protein
MKSSAKIPGRAPGASETAAAFRKALAVLGFCGGFGTAAHAAEWVSTDGDFGTGANWAEGTVPDGVSAANITNGGNARMDIPAAFTINALTVGGHAGQGSIAQSAGCLNTLHGIIGGDDSGGGSGQGSYRITGGTFRSLGGEIWIGSKGGQGSLEISGDSLVSSASWMVIGRDGASGHLALSGNGQLEVLSGNLPVGCNSNGHHSTMDIGDFARVHVAEELWVGWLGDNSNQGSLAISGHASVSTGKGIVIGREGAEGSVDVSGSASLNTGGFLICGADAGGKGHLFIRGEAHVHAAKQVWIGHGGASGNITLTGGCLTGHAAPDEDPSGAGIAFRHDGLLTLAGGRLSTPGFIKTGGVARLVFNGGLLRATGTTTSDGFFVNFTDDELWIGPEGLKFDTKALTIEVEQSLGGVGSLAKQGAGTLRIKGTHGHDGDTEIVEGRVQFSSPILSDSHRVVIDAETGRLALDHGQVDRVAKLVIAGVVKPPGRYEAAGNPGNGVEIPQLEGTGSLEVRFGPGDLTFAEWIAAHAPAAGFDADSDHDGLPNGIEQVFGTDPNAFNPAPAFRRDHDGSSFLTHSLAPVLAADAAYHYEWSSNLYDWHRGGVTDADGLRVDIDFLPVVSGAEARYLITSGSASKLFGRVVATLDSSSLKTEH